MPPKPPQIEFQSARARELSALIGPAATLMLIERYGGYRCSVPRNVRSKSALSDLVGIEAAAKLIGQYGGLQLTVPLEQRAFVLWLHNRGYNMAQITRRIHRHRKSIQAMLAK